MVARRASLRSGEAVELSQQLRRLCEQFGDVLPHGLLERLRLDGTARADRWAGAQDAILAVAIVVLPFWQARRGGTRNAEHGETTGFAGEQASQQVAVLGVVAKRQRGVACQLRLRPIPNIHIDQRRDRDGDPLFTRLQATCRRLAGARAALSADAPR